MKRLAACLWALQASAAFGGPEGVGTTSADFLKIPAAARPAAMGEAFAGLADDESSLTYNPSGIARPLEHSLSATHVEWFQGIRLEHLGGVLALGEQGGLAVDLSWLQVDAMARTLRVANSADPLSNYAEIGSFSPHDAALGLGYARPFGKSFNTGLSAHFIQQNIDAQNGYGLGLDLGAQWLGLPGGLDLGLVIKHLGTPLALGSNGSQLPLDFRLGVLKRMKGLPLLWSAELGIPVDGQLMPGVGVEGELYRLLALRAGWRGGYANQFSAGLGFKLAGFKLDYAWVPFELLGPTHRLTLTKVFSAVSLGLDLDRDLIGPLGDMDKRVALLFPRARPAGRLRRWRLELTDAEGKIRWAREGQGTPPASIPWDGHGSDGQLLPDSTVSAVFEGEFEAGPSRRSQSQAIELDSTPPALNIAVGPKVRRMDGREAVILPARFNLRGADKHGVADWSLEIRLEGGSAPVRTYSGIGAPPESQVWDGLDFKGDPLQGSRIYVTRFSARDKLGNRAETAPLALLYLAKLVRFNLAADALFESGRANVLAGAYQDLLDMSVKIKAYVPKGSVVEIVGHTDDVPVGGGLYRDNQGLSLARAEAVIKFLTQVLGMDPKMFKPVGKADREPVADNATPEGRQKNRRVEIVIQGKSYE